MLTIVRMQLVGCEAVGALQEADAEAARLQRRASLVSRLRQKIASARAALDTHMRAEEANIWPLFSEHFTIEEQSALVGAVIGRTGADVLQALIPWVMGSVSDAEKTAMFDSLRQATANTHFDEWMKKMVPVDILKEGDTARAAERGRAAWETVEGQEGVWPESKAVADVTAYQPGWSDIFRMNATQLEAAAAGGDGTGDMVGERDLRRSYLTHNLLVSCFLVAQQQRMGQAAVVTPEASTAPRVAGDGTPHGGCKHYRAACALVAPCCGAVVACRLCHDEAGECGVAFDQYAVREMRCNLCDTLQLVAQRCSKCKASMARYYCSICHLFDDDPSALPCSVVFIRVFLKQSHSSRDFSGNRVVTCLR
jgi:zinc finger-like protein